MVSSDDQATATAAARPDAEDARERPTHWALSVVAHPIASILGRRILLSDTEPVTLGRGIGLLGHQGLDDKELSRRHAQLLPEASGVRLTDLGSRNGTWVAGRRVDGALLDNGSLVVVGRIGLLLHRARRHLVLPKTRMVAASLAMMGALDQIHDAASRDRSVLIEGETGVGKELVARELHAASGRPGAFVAVNCAAIGDGVLHSELFGHVQGAFSGATRDRPGLISEAEEGTIFLDEIGDASPALQAALLRLLEQGEYRRVGEDRVRRSGARVVAATHVDLRAAIDQGRFRRDLHGRLARWHVQVPPLRERPADIPPIAWGALEQLGDPRPMSIELVGALLRHEWLTNARELVALVEQAAAESKGEVIGVTLGVRGRLQTVTREAPARVARSASPRGPRPERASRDELIETVKVTGGNMRQAAQELGVSRATLYRWLAAEELDVATLREDAEKGGTT